MTEKQPDGSGFVHLHVHAENSQLDGFARVKTIPSTAAALGQKALALTDHGSLAGAWKFQKNCLAAGIKPIIGTEIYMAIGSRHERNFETVINDDDNATDADEGKEKTKRYMHLTILARNEDGWKSLLALHNKAEDSYWYKPRIDFDLIDEHGEGLIILTGCLGGPVAGPLSRAGAAEKQAEQLRKEIGAHQTLARELSEPDSAPYGEAIKAGQAPEELSIAQLAAAAPKLALFDELTALTKEKRAEARANLDRLITAVGREHVFLEVMHHGIKAETHAFREIRALSAETGIPMVATNDCHYEHAEDAEGHDGFLAVGVKKSKDDPNRFRFNGTPDYYVKSEAQMLDVLGNISNEEAAKAWRDAVAMSVHVADLCADKVIPDPKMRLPSFPVPEGFADERAYFHHLVKEGAIERFGTDPETGAKRPVPLEVRQRLRVEEDIICDMGFPAYFLIVWDVIAWARSDYSAQDWVDKHAGKPVNEETRTRKKPIMVGVGRGSAAGSMASYCLKIVGVDPIENHLLFERFLEPGRAGMPDIDVDFEAARRAEVFSYLGVRWGKDRVAHIGTFGMALSKAAIKDAARILKPHGPAVEITDEAAGLRADGEFAKAGALIKRASIEAERRGSALQSLGNKMSDLVPSNGGKAFTFAQLDNTNDAQGAAFRDLVAESGQDAQDILKLARAFEGITKTESIHACGFIISPEPLDDIVPMRWQSHAASADPNAPRVICWDGPDCEELGLLKMDVLGLTNLDIASTALDYIRDTTGTVFTLEEIPHPSTKGNTIVDGAYGLMAAGRTSGLFQMESAGMIKIAQSVVPENLDDVSAIVALFRPGPLKAGMDRSYAARKSGEEPVTYTDFTNDPVETAAIDKVLGATYGMAIYQETIMRLSTTVAGFDAAQRSRLRKAMGKKKQSEMDACLTMWLEGAPKEFLDEDGSVISPVFSPVSAQKLWDFISGAASYLFNACLTGESVLHGDRGARWTIEDLYFRLHGNDEATPGLCPNCNDRPSRPNTPMCTRCATWLYKFRDSRGFDLLAYDHSDGRIRPQRVKDVHQNGVRPVFRITLDDGKEIRATGNHRFLTPSGYVHVDDLVVGGELTINGGYEKQLTSYPERRTTTGERAAVAGNKPWLPGEKNSGFVDGGFVKLREWTERTIASAACDECGCTHADGRLERAHLDGNRTNNDASNLAWKCPSHHKAYDYAANGRLARWQKGHRPDAARIVSIVPDGEEMVYDVEMEEGTDHNFVVNGIVSHNSHSAAYGQLAYYTAYLKSGWPVEYSAAILAVADKEEKRLTALSALRADGIEVLSPDVNKSKESTAPVDGKILFGLSEIKDVGVNGTHIVAEREANGPFTSMADLIERVKVPSEKSPSGYGKVPTGALQGLIEAGAMDSFGPRLGLLMSMRAANGNPNVPVPDAVWNILEEATRQRQRLGVSLGIHPLTALREQLAAWRTPGEGEYGDSTGSRPTPLHKIPDRNGAPVLTLGVLSQWDEKAYGGGRRANFAIESSKTSIQGVLWNRTLAGLRSNGNVPKIGDIVAVSGKVNVRSTVVGDEDSDSQETISTKELNVFELWPVKTQNTSLVPRETPEGSNVLSFADLYRKVRTSAPQGAPEPPKGGGEPAPSPSEAEPRQNVVSLEAARQERARQEPVFAAVSAWGTARVGTSIISGSKEAAAVHAWTMLPAKKLTSGDVFRADLTNGTRLYALVEDMRFTEEQVVEMVKACQDDDSRWELIDKAAPQKDVTAWYRLTSAASAADQGQNRESVAV